MRKIIFIIAFLITSFAFTQGGPKVDVVKFRGEVTTTVRNTFDVPVGEYWMIYNTTTDHLEMSDSTDSWVTVIKEGQNTIDEGIYLTESITNSISIIPASAGYLGGVPAIRIIGGAQGSETYYVIANDRVSWTFGASAEEYRINSAGETNADDLTRKSYVDAEIAAIPSGSDDQNASEVPITDTGAYYTATDVEGALQEIGANVGSDDQIASEVPFTPNGSISSTNVQLAIQEVRDEESDWSTPVNSNITPDTNEAYFLGSPTFKFLAGYFSDIGADTGSISEFTTTKSIRFADASFTPASVTNGLIWYDFPNGTLKIGDSGAYKSFLLEGDVTASEVPITDTANFYASTDVEGALSELGNTVKSDTTGLANAIPVGSIVFGNVADIELWPDNANRLTIPLDATPATTVTGTVLSMDGYGQIDDRLIDTATFTLTDIEEGGYYEVLVNQATEPTITGATKLVDTADFIPNSEMLMVVKVFGSTVKYFFLDW